MSRSTAPSSLTAFAEFMNPCSIDLAPSCPRILPAVANNPRNPQGGLRLGMPGIDPGAIILGNGTIIQGDVTIGRGSTVFEGVYMRADKGPKIIVGENCDIQDGVTIHVSATRQTNTIIGDGATLAHRGVCHGAIIGKHAFIALNAILNDGCEVGEGAFVDSGTTVDAEAILQAGKQYKGHVPAFYRNPKYGRNPNDDPCAVGETKDIIVADRAGSTHPLGDLDGRYPKSQVLGANARRWIQAGELGDYDLIHNRARPAMGYVEAAQMEQGKLYLEQARNVLASIFHNHGQHISIAGGNPHDILLAQHTFHLVSALNHTYRGTQAPPEVDAAWSHKADILSQLGERLSEVHNALAQRGASLPANTALRKPVLLNAEDIEKTMRRLHIFNEEIRRIERQIEHGVPSPHLDRPHIHAALLENISPLPGVEGGITVTQPDSSPAPANPGAKRKGGISSPPARSRR